jgi:hypothetical protein
LAGRTKAKPANPSKDPVVLKRRPRRSCIEEEEDAARDVLLLRALGCCRAEVVVVDEEKVLGRTKAWVLAQAATSHKATRQATTAMTELRMMMMMASLLSC